MRQIPVSRSLAVFLDELWFTEAALAADDEASDLAPLFDQAINDWEAMAQRERSSRRAVVRAEAVVAVRNEQIDADTTRFSSLVLVEAGNDRKSTFFKRFFPESPSVFIARNLRDQSEQTRDRIVPEIKKQPETSLLWPFAEKLSARAKAALSALTGRTRARSENATVVSDVTEWKEGINRLRTTTYAELLKRATEKRLGRDWAETFYRRDEGASADVGEPVNPDPVTPVTPT